jgi:hypothetical protein
MRLSLINVYKRNTDGTVDGSLIQNKMAGSIEEAVEFAKQTKAVNGNKIDIAVVPEVAGFPWDGQRMMLVPLAIV